MLEAISQFLFGKKVEEEHQMSNLQLSVNDAQFPEYNKLKIKIDELQKKYGASYFKPAQLEDRIALLRSIQTLYPSLENPQINKPCREYFMNIYDDFFNCPSRCDEEEVVRGGVKKLVNELKNQCQSIDEIEKKVRAKQQAH